MYSINSLLFKKRAVTKLAEREENVLKGILIFFFRYCPALAPL